MKKRRSADAQPKGFVKQAIDHAERMISVRRRGRDVVTVTDNEPHNSSSLGLIAGARIPVCGTSESPDAADLSGWAVGLIRAGIYSQLHSSAKMAGVSAKDATELAEQYFQEDFQQLLGGPLRAVMYDIARVKAAADLRGGDGMNPFAGADDEVRDLLLLLKQMWTTCFNEVVSFPTAARGRPKNDDHALYHDFQNRVESMKAKGTPERAAKKRAYDALAKENNVGRIRIKERRRAGEEICAVVCGTAGKNFT